MFKPLSLNTEYLTENLCSSANTIISLHCPIAGHFLSHLQCYSKMMIPRLLRNICTFKYRMLSVCVCIMSQDRSTSIARRLQNQHPRNHGSIPSTGKNHIFSKVSRLILKPTQFSTQWVMEGGAGGEVFFPWAMKLMAYPQSTAQFNL
jgi:hypothetical protein